MKFKFDIQFFGGGGSASSQQYRVRDPEEPQLTNLRKGLYDAVMPNLQMYDPSRWQTAQQTADSSLKSAQSLFEQAGAAGAKGSATADELLNLLRTGAVPQPMENAAMGTINRGLKSGMGEMLSGLGSRGVLNSSVTNTGISGLGTKAANAFQDSYLNNFNSLVSGYQGALQGLQGNTSALLGAAQGFSGLGGQAFENAGASLMPAYNLWKDAQSMYDGRTDFDTVVTQGSGK